MRMEDINESEEVFREEESPSPPKRPRKLNEVIFDFPQNEFRLQTFPSISNLKSALKLQPGALKASFKTSSNSHHVGLHCKVPSCQAFLSYTIRRGQEEILEIRSKT